MADEPVAPTGPDVVAPNPKMRGAKPTPRHVLAAAEPFRPGIEALLAPAQFAVVPPQLSMWGNSQYGDCVSAEEAFAKAAWSVMNGYPETFISEADVIAWARKYDYLNGAYLTEVMDTMKLHGMPAGGSVYTDGNYKTVDYSNEGILQAALLQGPVKIGIDADALPSGAGNKSGWYALGSGRNYPNEDHCTGLCGFGPAEYLYQQLGVPMPAALAGKTGYLHFTWNTIGFVDHAWLMSTCAEAWVRVPTTPEQSPTPPTPPTPPNPPTPPTPPVPPAAHVDIPALAVKVFGLSIGTTVATSVPVTYTAKATVADVWQILKDFGKLLSDAGNKSFADVFADVVALLKDFGVLASRAGFGPVVPIWQLLVDGFALVTAIASKNWPAAATALMKLLADFGINLSREQLAGAMAPNID